jgi:hypothetical protein
MATTKINSIFDFNGVISTNKTVLQNLQTMADAAGVFLVYDCYSGKWQVVINGIADPVATITDSNIVGSVQLTSASTDQIYDTVEISFPNKDVMDKEDQLTFQIDITERYPYEQLNILNIKTDLINDSAAAGIMAMRQLRQTRLDKILKFQTDYSMIGLTPGDVIRVTIDALGYENKKFRIITIEENDADNGTIALSFTLLEYDDKVYDYSNIQYYKRFNGTSVTQIATNQQIQELDAMAAAGLPISQLYAFTTPTPIEAEHTPTPTPTSISTGFEYTVPYDGIYLVDYTWNWVFHHVVGAPPIDLGVYKVYGVSLRNGNNNTLINLKFTGLDQAVAALGSHRQPDYGTTNQTVEVFLSKGTLLKFETYLVCDYVGGKSYLNFDADTYEPYQYTLVDGSKSLAYIIGRLSLLKKLTVQQAIDEGYTIII